MATEIKVGVRATSDQHTGATKSKDVVQAIRTGVARIVMSRELPGSFALEIKEGPLQGTIEFHAQPSETSGQFMYYGQGKDLHIGKMVIPNVGMSVMFPKGDPSNFIDDDTLKLYKAAKLCAKGGKDAGKLTTEQRALLKAQGVDVEAEINKK